MIGTWILLGVGTFVGSVILMSLRIVREYEKGVRFTLGKYTGVVQPGLRLVVPLIQQMVLVDLRQRTIDLPAQDVMTKDQVNLSIDGVVFYNVTNAAQTVLHVQHVEHQLRNTATAELKEIVGDLTMSSALQKREFIASSLKRRLQDVVNDSSVPEKLRQPWGIVVRNIQINNVELPENLVRAMAKEAEAEREKKAIVIRALGEQEASKKYSEASIVYRQNPAALRLRELKTWEEIGKEQNTLMIVVPPGEKMDKMALAALGRRT